MTSNNSLNIYLSFNGEVYVLWKENMRIFIEEMDYDLNFNENGHFIPTYLVDCVMVNKYRNIWIKKDKEKVQRSLKAKTIITTAFAICEFLHASHCDATKKI